MTIDNMSVRDFWKLPSRKWDDEIPLFSGLVILPQRTDWLGLMKYRLKRVLAKLLALTPPEIWEVGHLHDSGYRCMDFVAVDKKNEAICRLAGCSDVIHIDGIGGYGKWSAETGVPKLVTPSDWSIDCLAKSGLLRMFCRGSIDVGAALSSFEIYAVKEK